ncbi:MAG: hypothetical protein Dasosvirus2_15 [Dasosvirus sp.]|uniref:Uncharacterized protein n=1 Tax=Dasosvirus sp. TaxID=2487764 RepID=A0A3G4ZVF5_9VIRU|nr:MAG: hypothetical protein Dasosvirus2_15 [Dasosvirus sp.]
MSTYRKYNILFDQISANDQSKYILTIVTDNNILIRSEYILIGSYIPSKNIWSWADNSLTLCHSMLEKTTLLRQSLLDKNNNDIKQFVKTDLSVYSTDTLKDYLNIIEKISDMNIVNTSNDPTRIIYVALDNIFFNNIQNI